MDNRTRRTFVKLVPRIRVGVGGFSVLVALASLVATADAQTQTQTAQTPTLTPNAPTPAPNAALIYSYSILSTPTPIATTPSYAPGYEPKGMPLGSFRIYPSVDLETGFDDNLYLTETDPKSSFFVTETPRLDIKSQWNRNELDLYGSLTGYQFLSLPSENHFDGIIGGSGRYDIMRGIDFSGSASYADLHLANSSPLYLTPAGLLAVPTEPTQFSQALANAAFNYHPYHFGVSVGINYTNLNYSSTTYQTFIQSNSDLDQSTYNPYVTLSYEFSPGYTAFVRGDYNTQVFNQALDRNGQNLNSSGESINTGLALKLTNFINGQAFIGYLNQNYEGLATTVSGIDYGAQLNWTPSVFWTVHFGASRTLNTSVLVNAPAEDDNVVRLGVDYAILRNVTIQAHASYWYAAFPGISRADQYPEAGLGVTYFLNNNVSMSALYDYQMRDSNVPGVNYQDNRFIIGINFHM